jgi:sulfite reductase (NADPH) hemoprotein beta-component
MVEEEFERIRHGALALPDEEVRRIESYFALPAALQPRAASSVVLDRARAANAALATWVSQNTVPHRISGHALVTVSLKPIGGTPGDATADQMDLMADLAERYSQGEIRVSHEQNLILPHVALDDLPALHEALAAANLATANAGLVTDIIACPGLDYCALANARSIPVAQRISERFADQARQQEVGDLKIKISGCINACGHHHVGHIGILGVEKKGEEFYQITLGGSGDETASVGEIIGPGFSSDEVVDAVEKVVDTYLKVRESRDENFLAAVRRLGIAPFKEALYGAA